MKKHHSWAKAFGRWNFLTPNESRMIIIFWASIRPCAWAQSTLVVTGGDPGFQSPAQTWSHSLSNHPWEAEGSLGWMLSPFHRCENKGLNTHRHVCVPGKYVKKLLCSPGSLISALWIQLFGTSEVLVGVGAAAFTSASHDCSSPRDNPQLNPVPCLQRPCSQFSIWEGPKEAYLVWLEFPRLRSSSWWPLGTFHKWAFVW